jgi:hypothetical protein
MNAGDPGDSRLPRDCHKISTSLTNILRLQYPSSTQDSRKW